MRRAGYKERVESVKRIVMNKSSIRGEAKQKGVDKNLMKFWLKLYQYHGKEALKGTNQKRIRCSEEEKMKVIKYYETHNLSLIECAAKFQLTNPSTLRRWLKKYEEDKE